MKIKTLALCLTLASMTVITACSGSANKAAEESAKTEAEMSEQPLESGQYEVTSYDITGANERKGNFDGRLLIALSPEQSAFYVYENGNRTKIDYKVVLAKPFEKTDSAYVTTDTKGNQILMIPDSTGYVLRFEKGKSTIAVNVDKTPKSTGTAMDIMERIADDKK